MICVYPVWVGYIALDVSYETPCTDGGHVLLTQAEYDEISASPLKLSLADGGAVGASIMLVWAIAFGIRMLIRVIRDSESSAVDAD